MQSRIEQHMSVLARIQIPKIGHKTALGSTFVSCTTAPTVLCLQKARKLFQVLDQGFVNSRAIAMHDTEPASMNS